MEKKLENIFVPYEIAKLAYQKGFREWCAGIDICDNSVGTILNTEEDDIDFEYFGNPSKGYYGLPTHFQLMDWLQSNHNVQITMHKEGGFTVFDKDGFMKFDKGKPRFEINKALEIALNTLPNVS